MNLRLLQLPKLIAERRSSAIFGMVIIAMLWAGIFLKYAGDVQDDKREAVRTNRNFAMVFEENVLRSIGEIDKALLYLRRSIETRQDSADFQTIANTDGRAERDHRPGRDYRRQGHHARLERRPAAGAPAMDLSDREHYQGPCRQQGGPALHQQAASSAAPAASGRCSSRGASRTSDGSFAGVVVASLNPAHSDEILRQDRFRVVRLDLA